MESNYNETINGIVNGVAASATDGIPARVPFTGEASDEQISAWKKSFPIGIYAVVNEENHIGYFKNPNRNEVNCALSMASAKLPLAPIEELAKLTFIGGSYELLNNDTMSLGVQNAIKEKLNGSMSILVNL